MRTLNVMTEDEAAKAGVKERRAYFRVDSAKGNKAPPSSGADWYQLRSYDLPNGRDGKLGDSVGVIDKWKWPNALDGVTVADLRAVQTAIAAGRWRKDPQAKDWAGVAVAKVLGLDVEDKANKAKIAAFSRSGSRTGCSSSSRAMTINRGLDRSLRSGNGPTIEHALAVGPHLFAGGGERWGQVEKNGPVDVPPPPPLPP